MATQVQRRKGTTVQHSTFTGASAELTVDSTKNTVVVHDGATAGGFPLAKESGSALSPSSVTLSGGTANGVAYLNGSKVLTTGSALTFDGTTFKVTGADAAINSIFAGATNGIRIIPKATSAEVAATDKTGTGSYQQLDLNGSLLTFLTSGTEGMRLTSTGLGIGTSSPGAKLHVAGSSAGVEALFSYSSGTPTIAIGNSATTYNTQIGYNVTSEYGYIQAVAAAGVYDDIAINPLGGNLGIGTSSPAAKLNVSGGQVYIDGTDSAEYLRFRGATIGFVGGIGSTAAYIGTYTSHALQFATGNTVKATLDTSGNLLVGTTGQVSNEKLNVTTTGDKQAALFKNDTNARANIISWVATTTGNAVFNEFYTETSITARGSISYNRGVGLVAYNTTSDYRAKDIIGLVTDSGALIDSTPVYMGKMKGATQERPMFIAHETPAYAHTGEKDAVDADGNPVYQQMDASALIPVMWAEIQSLRKRLADAGIA